MSSLIVLLPDAPSGPGAGYGFVQTRDGMQVDHQGHAAVSALPYGGVSADVVAVVPGSWLSWHAVDLPKGSLTGGAGRLRAVLEGLLEDRLLDEPSGMHFALDARREGATVWVAVCDRARLQAALAPLEAANRPVSRIVPEFAPLPHTQDTPRHRLFVGGTADEPWLTHVHAQGVTMLPLTPQGNSWWPQAGDTDTDIDTYAEPAVYALASERWGTAVRLQQAPERWLQAVQSPWDLAQFELENSRGRRIWKKIGDLLSSLSHAPRWRAARWGVGLALLVNLVGLNAWAWKEQSALARQRADVQSVLTSTFAHVKVVIDAPVQMTRELALLRQSAGASSRQDLENLLSAVGQAMPPSPGLEFSALHYTDGELNLKSTDLQSEAVQALASALGEAGLAVRQETDRLSIRPATAPGGKP